MDAFGGFEARLTSPTLEKLSPTARSARIADIISPQLHLQNLAEVKVYAQTNSPLIPLELHQINAYQFYRQRIALGKEGSDIDDWHKPGEYLAQHPRTILTRTYALYN